MAAFRGPGTRGRSSSTGTGSWPMTSNTPRLCDALHSSYCCGAAEARRTAHPPRSTAIVRAFSDPTTGASRGRSSATATLGRSTSAGIPPSTRTTTRTSTSPACTWRSRSTAARRSCCSTTRAASSTSGEDEHAVWIDPKNGQPHPARQRCRLRGHVGPGRGAGEYVRTTATALVLLGDGGHGPSVLRVHGPSGQRQLGRPELDAESDRHSRGHDWFHLGGGDGFQTAVDPTDFRIVYSSSQDGRCRASICERVSHEHPSGGAAGAGYGGSRARAGTGGRGGGLGGRGGGRGTALTAGSRRPPASMAERRWRGRWRRRWRWGRGGGTPNVINAESRRGVSLQLEHAATALAAQPGHDLARRQPAIQVRTIAAIVGRERRSTKQVDRCKVTVMGVAGTRRSSRRTTASRRTARSSPFPSRR